MINDECLGGVPHVHHRFYVHHLAGNFHYKFHDKSLAMLVVMAAYERWSHKLDYQNELVLVSVRRHMHGYELVRWRNGLYPTKGEAGIGR